MVGSILQKPDKPKRVAFSKGINIGIKEGTRVRYEYDESDLRVLVGFEIDGMEFTMKISPDAFKMMFRRFT